MNLRYTDRARVDLEIAFNWYEDQRHGLGHEFLNCVESVIRNIIHMPEMYSVQHDNFRRAIVRRFPFSIFYTVEKNEIVVHAFFDNRQDPARLP